MSNEAVQAYAVDGVTGVEAIDGLVIIKLAMRGGARLCLGLAPATAEDVGAKLNFAEIEAAAKKQA